MFKLFLKVFGITAIVIGIMAIGGSANDCDGKCMEYANDIPTMLMVTLYGFIAVIGGGACLYASNKL